MPVDFIVGAAVGAAVASQPVRQAVRQGLVYGLGGILVAYDTVTAMGRRSPAAAPDKSAAPAPENGAPPSPTSHGADAGAPQASADAASPTGVS
jgi:hypothetical protein